MSSRQPPSIIRVLLKSPRSSASWRDDVTSSTTTRRSLPRKIKRSAGDDCDNPTHERREKKYSRDLRSWRTKGNVRIDGGGGERQGDRRAGNDRALDVGPTHGEHIRAHGGDKRREHPQRKQEQQRHGRVSPTDIEGDRDGSRGADQCCDHRNRTEENQRSRFRLRHIRGPGSGGRVPRATVLTR